jgi:asparagine synthase (glutamine-hydrolysing)
VEFSAVSRDRKARRPSGAWRTASAIAAPTTRASTSTRLPSWDSAASPSSTSRADTSLANEDDSVWIAFNGEIYNHEQLRTGLERKGHRYRTRSDTETIVHLYEQEGPLFARKMNGMFAIALWDRKKRTLVLVRDRLGIKPLYYAQAANGSLAFASEIKALRQCPGVDTSIDPLALDSYLALQYVPGPRTIHRGIHKLPPGHVLTVSDNGMHIEPFWTLEPEPAPATFEEAREAFMSLFEDAVRIRLMSDVPLGAFLSGGLDSALVVAAMAKAMDRPVQTFSIGFEGEGWYSELPHAEAVAKLFNAEHHTLTVKATDMRELLPMVTAHSTSRWPTWPRFRPTCSRSSRASTSPWRSRVKARTSSSPATTTIASSR